MNSSKRTRESAFSSSSSRVSTSDETRFESCREWLNKSSAIGLDSSRLTFEMKGGMLGAWAQQDFKVGDVLFEVPLSCLYGIDNVQTASEMTKKVRDTAKITLGDPQRCTSELLIWLGMIEARSDQGHHHHPYMQSLDNQMTPNILQWPRELVNVMTLLRPQMTADVEAMLRGYAELLDTAKLNPTVYNCDSLLWAYGHYVSRRYPGKYSKLQSVVGEDCPDGRESRLGDLGIMVPALDILNHGDSSIEWLKFKPTNTHLLVIINQHRKKGDQLWSNYGSISNERLLFAYGFATENNENDQVAIHLKMGNHHGGPPIDHGVHYLERGGSAGVPSSVWTSIQSMRVEEDDDEVEDEVEVKESEEEMEGGIAVDLFEVELLRDFAARLLSKFSSPSLKSLLQEAADAHLGADIRYHWLKHYIQGNRDVLTELISDLDAMTGAG